MIIRDEKHPIKKVSGFRTKFTGVRDYDYLMSLMNIDGTEMNYIGKTSDGGYSMFSLTYGDISGKTLILNGGLHGGTEWLSVYYCLEIFRALCNPEQYPAQRKELELIRNAYDGILYFPSGNPWGFNNGTRGNYLGVDLNRDFTSSPSSQETINLINEIFRVGSPEILIDCHERSSMGASIASVDTMNGLDSHYSDKIYTAIRYISELMGGEMGKYHGLGGAANGEMRRWSINTLRNSRNERTNSYIIEAGNRNDINDLQMNFLRGLNSIFAILLAYHLPLNHMTNYIGD